MDQRTLVLDDLKERALEDVLREVVARQEAIAVHLPEGETVLIHPAPRLKPLPVLEGSIASPLSLLSI